MILSFVKVCKIYSVTAKNRVPSIYAITVCFKAFGYWCERLWSSLQEIWNAASGIGWQNAKKLRICLVEHV